MYKFVIADDEAIIREGIKSLLDWESLGFTFAGEASNSNQAFDLIMKEQPDLALFDIRMPGITGLECIANLRQKGFEGTFVILSGYSDFAYAKEAITQGVQAYLTKPIDEDELEEIIVKIKGDLDLVLQNKKTTDHFKDTIRERIVKDLLLGNGVPSSGNLTQFHLDAEVYQVVIYEKYSHQLKDPEYSFAELLRVTNRDQHSYNHVLINYQNVLLLKGEHSIKQFENFLLRYEKETKPQKDSPLDSLFIAYGQKVNSAESIEYSFQEASQLMERRFFCDNKQHTFGYTALPNFTNTVPIVSDELISNYASLLGRYIQSFNRNMVAETLNDLKDKLYNASDSIDSIKLFLADLFLQIKTQITHIYTNIAIPFSSNAEIIKAVEEKYYLYEILLYFTEQFEIIMQSIGNSSRDSVLDDILNYIGHNYPSNITLENIAPLFGYNSSYLGKIFNKKMGESFNSYIDRIRIEHAKEILLSENIKVYAVAERVGYRNVDYFHIKFKKHVGKSPAEYRKEHRAD